MGRRKSAERAHGSSAIWAAMAVWSLVLFGDRAQCILRAIGSGASTSGTWCRRSGARSHGHPLEVTDRRDGRADRSARRPCRSVPGAPRAGVGRLAVAAGPRASHRSSSWRSARCPSSGSAAVTSTPRRRRRCSRSAYLAYPWIGHERGGSDPSRDVRDHVLPLLRLVPRHRAAGPVRGLRVCSRCRRASSWAFRSRPSASGSLSPAAGGVAGALDHRLGVSRGPFVARLRRSCPHFAGESSIFYGFYDERRRIAGRRR